MTDKQPEALRLAACLEEPDHCTILQMRQAAAELRRLHEVETKYHESIGGFKRDLAEKLAQQRGKNKRLTAELRRLHEVNAELVEALREAADEIDHWGSYASDYFRIKHDLAGSVRAVYAAIAKATGEQQ
jgi:hypothetical protein